jgi:gluconate 5-dehydrogenase
MEQDLKEKVAFVTGATSGLGRRFARVLAGAGAAVAIAARRVDRLQALKDEIESEGGRCAAIALDVTDVKRIPAVLDEAEAALGPIDILINNAGTAWGAPMEDHPLESWQKVVDLNLTGTFRVTQEVGKRCMLPRRYGRIVNIASVAGLQGSHPEVFRAIAYQTTKGGLVNFTRALAAEWGRHHIVVNAICPGFIVTKMSRATLDKIAPLVKQSTPLRQLGEEQDLQGLVVMLSSAAARHITGQIIAVDGGSSIV